LHDFTFAAVLNARSRVRCCGAFRRRPGLVFVTTDVCARGVDVPGGVGRFDGHAVDLGGAAAGASMSCTAPSPPRAA
jgi:hypothetical protein